MPNLRERRRTERNLGTGGRRTGGTEILEEGGELGRMEQRRRNRRQPQKPGDGEVGEPKSWRRRRTRRTLEPWREEELGRAKSGRRRWRTLEPAEENKAVEILQEGRN
ncbi:hypothetical protein AVEN_176489-1 [Araneus ventricosus]|uniref:Uncharacterized protein n=1 Tax=Araneus ventricosus TaxID=182803 RepID=A0A4Y2KZB3_ARAVE|nr:hypothetical protein AVEN_176489-1 [Araneus ventricosus]